MLWDSGQRIIRFNNKARIQARKAEQEAQAQKEKIEALVRKEKLEEFVRLLAKIREKKRLDKIAEKKRLAKITKLCLQGLFLTKTWRFAGRHAREADIKSLRDVAEKLRMLTEC